MRTETDGPCNREAGRLKPALGELSLLPPQHLHLQASLGLPSSTLTHPGSRPLASCSLRPSRQLSKELCWWQLLKGPLPYPGIDEGGMWDQARWVASGDGLMGAPTGSKGNIKGFLERGSTGFGARARGLHMASDFSSPGLGFLISKRRVASAWQDQMR